MRILIVSFLLFLTGCSMSPNSGRNYIISHSDVEEVPVSNDIVDEN